VNSIQKCILIDSTEPPFQQPLLFPYALDEWVCRRMDIASAAVIHIWRHPRAFVLGLRDSRLPHVKKAAEWLESLGYETIVRNSGGSAVPLDLGVVNISLVLPHLQKTVNFCDDFGWMVNLIRQSLQTQTSEIQVGEIKQSYCPGDFDLSIQGKKFCGMAERRQAKGFVIQAFVNVVGTGGVYAQLEKSFYQLAANGADERDATRHTDLHTATLSELLNLNSASLFIESFKQAASNVFPIMQLTTIEQVFDSFTMEQIRQTMNQLRTRYALNNF